jgi:pimeloyl-ACP methyl ester carboxylesterase
VAGPEDLHHVDLGEGPSIVLIHGLASNLHLWDGVAKRLEQSRHRVVACDLRGHGQSPKPEGHYDVPTVAGDVIALIERLQLGACLLAGQSYGGTVALQVAAARPDLTAAVVCVDGGFLDLGHRYPDDWDKCRRELSPPQLVGRPLKAIRLRMRSQQIGWPQEGIEGQLACFEVRDDGTVAPWLTRERHIEVLRGFWEVDAPGLWSRVQAPVLLVAAERPGSMRKGPWHDDIHRCSSMLSEHTRTATVWMEGDHDLHAQHPDQVAKLIEDWGRGQLEASTA